MFKNLTLDETNTLFHTLNNAITDVFSDGWTFEANAIADEFREIRADVQAHFDNDLAPLLYV